MSVLPREQLELGRICGTCAEFGRPFDPDPLPTGPCRGYSAFAPGCQHWRFWGDDEELKKATAEGRTTKVDHTFFQRSARERRKAVR